MKQEIINQMQLVVESTMVMYKTDFYNFDLKELEGYDGKFIWQVAPGHTHLHLCGKEYLDDILKNEATLYAYCQNSTWASACLCTKTKDERVFSYDDEKSVFCEINYEEALRRWEICKTAALNRWQLYNMELLPSDFKVRIEFMHHDVREYFIEQVRYSHQNDDDSLMQCLRRFRHYMKKGAKHKIVISRDFTDRSFLFHEDFGNGRYGINGGIIFHGYPKEGYKENRSVQLSPKYGWSIHT